MMEGTFSNGGNIIGWRKRVNFFACVLLNNHRSTTKFLVMQVDPGPRLRELLVCTFLSNWMKIGIDRSRVVQGHWVYIGRKSNKF